MRHVILLCGLLSLAAWGICADPPGGTTLRFEVTVAKGLLAGPRDGRLLLVLAKSGRPEPRSWLGKVEGGVPPYLGRDANAFGAGSTVTLDESCIIFPNAHLSKLPKGEYHV